MGLRNNNILSLLEVKTEDYGERVALGMKNSFGWKEFTYKGIGLLSRKLAHYFINWVCKKVNGWQFFPSQNRNTGHAFLRQ